MTDFRALCQELMDAIDFGIPVELIKQSPLAVRVDAALAQPEPQGPTDEEIMEVFWEHQNGLEELWADDWPAAARAVLARWGNQ
jgi:hypothetical protein